MYLYRYEIDDQRTAELNQPELLVISNKGDDEHFFCILIPSITYMRCPKCGITLIRNQGNMQRNYLDVIPRDDDAVLITVSLEYRKSKCLIPGCGCVFYPQFTFASRYARTTHRLEDAIVRMILREGYSYTNVSEMLNGRLSRQVIGQIFHRRVEELNTDATENSAWYRILLQESPSYYYEIFFNHVNQKQ